MGMVAHGHVWKPNKTLTTKTGPCEWRASDHQCFHEHQLAHVTQQYMWTKNERENRKMLVGEWPKYSVFVHSISIGHGMTRDCKFGSFLYITFIPLMESPPQVLMARRCWDTPPRAVLYVPAPCSPYLSCSLTLTCSPANTLLLCFKPVLLSGCCFPLSSIFLSQFTF